MIEINANLEDENYGIKNFDKYVSTVQDVYQTFSLLFGEDLVSRYPLYIDNSYSHGGSLHTIKPALNQFIILKTGITDGEDVSELLFQLSYNLTHLVFYSRFGLERPYQKVYSAYCTAMALSIVRLHNKSDAEFQEMVLGKHYAKGIAIAKRNDYDVFRIAADILNFEMK